MTFPRVGNPTGIVRRQGTLKIAVVIILIMTVFSITYRAASAADLQIRIYSSLTPGSGLFEYGRHYNESNVAFGARDFNFADDSGATVYLRATLVKNQTYPIRYHYWPSQSDSCVSIAKMQQQISGQWIEIGGTELHFVHMATRASEGYTSSISTAGQSISQSLGTIGTCGTAYPHSHMSGDVGTTSLMAFGALSNETCWTNYEYGFQCPATYPDHVSCPNTWSGYASISGTVSEYICAEWPKKFVSTNDVIFMVSY